MIMIQITVLVKALNIFFPPSTNQQFIDQFRHLIHHFTKFIHNFPSCIIHDFALYIVVHSYMFAVEHQTRRRHSAGNAERVACWQISRIVSERKTFPPQLPLDRLTPSVLLHSAHLSGRLGARQCQIWLICIELAGCI